MRVAENLEDDPFRNHRTMNSRRDRESYVCVGIDGFRGYMVHVGADEINELEVFGYLGSGREGRESHKYGCFIEELCRILLVSDWKTTNYTDHLELDYCRGFSLPRTKLQNLLVDKFDMRKLLAQSSQNVIRFWGGEGQQRPPPASFLERLP